MLGGAEERPSLLRGEEQSFASRSSSTGEREVELQVLREKDKDADSAGSKRFPELGLYLHHTIPPERWCVTRADLAAFHQEVLEEWRVGRIPDDDEFPNADHNDRSIGPNMYQVNQYIIAPRTKLSGGMSWALMLHPDGIPCDLFVTHAWAEGVFEFVHKMLHAWPRGAQNMWCCFLAIPQNLEISAMLNVPVEETPFAKALRVSSWTVVVPNRTGSIYTRLWCVMECYLAGKWNKKIQLPISVRKRDTMYKGAALILALVLGIFVGHFTGGRIWVAEPRPTFVRLSGSCLAPNMTVADLRGCCCVSGRCRAMQRYVAVASETDLWHFGPLDSLLLSQVGTSEKRSPILTSCRRRGQDRLCRARFSRGKVVGFRLIDPAEIGPDSRVACVTWGMGIPSDPKEHREAFAGWLHVVEMSRTREYLSLKADLALFCLLLTPFGFWFHVMQFHPLVYRTGASQARLNMISGVAALVLMVGSGYLVQRFLYFTSMARRAEEVLQTWLRMSEPTGSSYRSHRMQVRIIVDYAVHSIRNLIIFYGYVIPCLIVTGQVFPTIAAVRRCQKLGLLEQEAQKLSFSSVRDATCTFATDEHRIREAIGGRENEVDETVRVLMAAGACNEQLLAESRQGHDMHSMGVSSLFEKLVPVLGIWIAAWLFQFMRCSLRVWPKRPKFLIEVFLPPLTIFGALWVIAVLRWKRGFRSAHGRWVLRSASWSAMWYILFNLAYYSSVEFDNRCIGHVHEQTMAHFPHTKKRSCYTHVSPYNPSRSINTAEATWKVFVPPIMGIAMVALGAMQAAFKRQAQYQAQVAVAIAWSQPLFILHAAASPVRVQAQSLMWFWPLFEGAHVVGFVFWLLCSCWPAMELGNRLHGDWSAHFVEISGPPLLMSILIIVLIMVLSLVVGYRQIYSLTCVVPGTWWYIADDDLDQEGRSGVTVDDRGQYLLPEELLCIQYGSRLSTWVVLLPILHLAAMSATVWLTRRQVAKLRAEHEDPLESLRWGSMHGSAQPSAAADGDDSGDDQITQRLRKSLIYW